MDAEQVLKEVTGRVRDALDAADARAREIVTDAEARAKKLIAEAEAEAERIRARAETESQQRVAQVRDALANIEGAMSGESKGSAPAAEVNPQPPTIPEPAPPVEPEPMPPAEPEPMPPVEPEPMPPGPEIEPPAPAQPDRESPAATNGSGAELSKDATAARIVAMKMALDGTPREEISAHLAGHYDIEGPDKLLDDVMARAKR